MIGLLTSLKRLLQKRRATFKLWLTFIHFLETTNPQPNRHF